MVTLYPVRKSSQKHGARIQVEVVVVATKP